MYKDPDKQREAVKLAVQRHRAKTKGITQINCNTHVIPIQHTNPMTVENNSWLPEIQECGHWWHTTDLSIHGCDPTIKPTKPAELTTTPPQTDADGNQIPEY